MVYMLIVRPHFAEHMCKTIIIISLVYGLTLFRKSMIFPNSWILLTL